MLLYPLPWIHSRKHYLPCYPKETNYPTFVQPHLSLTKLFSICPTKMELLPHCLTNYPELDTVWENLAIRLWVFLRQHTMENLSVCTFICYLLSLSPLGHEVYLSPSNTRSLRREKTWKRFKTSTKCSILAICKIRHLLPPLLISLRDNEAQVVGTPTKVNKNA